MSSVTFICNKLPYKFLVPCYRIDISKTHFNCRTGRGNFAGDKALETRARWTPLKTKETFETLVKINWILVPRNFSATGIKSWPDTLYLHWNATSFFRVENWIGIFTLWCNLGFRRDREITLNTLLMNQVLQCFIIIITYMALIFRSHSRKRDN